MRLTLRTMLAYLDDTLEPADAQDIGEKIDESEFATSLVGRIRDCMRRLRLGAPRIEGTGAGDDPNSVAEYLDNTMKPERVLEFEKMCLESDVHLAEVASSHQILTLVLGEMAEVDSASRERMYAIIDGPGSAVPARAGSARQCATAASGGDPVEGGRRKVEVPDYLREQSSWRGWVSAAVGVGIVAMLLLVAFIAIRPPGGDADVAEANRPPRAGAAVDDAVDLESAAAHGTSTSEPVAEAVPPAIDPAASVGVADEAEMSLPEEEIAEPPPVVAPDIDDSAAVPTDEGVAPMPPADEAAGASPSTPSLNLDSNLPDESAATEPSDRSVPADDVESAAPSGAAEIGERLLDAVKPLGRVVSDQAILLTHDASGNWSRAVPGESIVPGQDLVALPAYRSVVTLQVGLTMHALAGTQFHFEPADAEGVVGFEVDRGRVVLMNVGGDPVSVWLRGGERAGKVTLDGIDTTVVVDVHHQRRAVTAQPVDPQRGGALAGREPLPLDNDKAAELYEPIVDLYVANGQATWNDHDTGQDQVIVAPARLVISSAAPPVPLEPGELPDWVFSDQLTPNDKTAAAELMVDVPRLDADLQRRLKELSDHRKIEVRALAVNCLAQMGDFEPMVAALNRDKERLMWDAHLATLVDAVASGQADAVRKGFKNQHGADGDELYRMLWAYGPETITPRDALSLVTYLDHEELIFRVMAFASLRAITGRTMFYRPDYTAAKRKPHVQKWRQLYEDGGIVAQPPAEP